MKGLGDIHTKVKAISSTGVLHLQNCGVKFQNFQRAITQKKSYRFFFKISPYNLLIVLYQLLKVSNTYTFRDIAFAMSKISKKGQ